MKLAGVVILLLLMLVRLASGQSVQLQVVVHDSEWTRNLETLPASGLTPTGTNTTGKQWWTLDWHYFVMPESLKEAFRSDGTIYTVLGDSNIVSGALMTNGVPRYPIVISLASEAIRDEEIAAFTNYVAAGGFMFVGSSAFTRTTNGTGRGDFAFANEMGVHMASPILTNWSGNTYLYKQIEHRLTSHIPFGQLSWRMPTKAEEIPWGTSPDHPFIAPHDVWKVQVTDATVLALGDATTYLTVKKFGNGYFIYCSAFQPFMGHSGFAPSTYSYLILRRAIEWAYESFSAPIPKLSPWPYQYNAAFMVRHDLENFTNEVADIENSARFEFTNGCRGDYYFCTGTLREDASPLFDTNAIVASLRRAVSNYGATIGPHNGGLKNPGNPALLRGQYDYWHWGPDEVLDLTPPGYPSGKIYALTSLTNAFREIESWLGGLATWPRTWVSPYFNATREDSYDLQQQANVKITGDQKLTPFPHWTLSTLTSGKRYPHLSEPVSDWFVGGLIAQSLEPWHPPALPTIQTLHTCVDFYYNLGALINFYSHTMSDGLGDAGQLTPEYVMYGANTNLHPRTWLANAVLIYDWWVLRSNVTVTSSLATTNLQNFITFHISGSTSTNTAVEALMPGLNSWCTLSVSTNGVAAGTNVFRVVGATVRVLAGTAVTNVVIGYYPTGPGTVLYNENLDSLAVPALPNNWSTSSSGGAVSWLTQSTNSDSVSNAFYVPAASTAGVSELVSPSFSLPPGVVQLNFTHNYDFDYSATNGAMDGGVLEAKIGTDPFTDVLLLGGNFSSGGYSNTLSGATGNPLGGSRAWSGTSSNFIPVQLNLPLPTASTVQFRWRAASDSATARKGWYVDNVAVTVFSCYCCNNPNTSPMLSPQTNRTIAELSSLLVTNAAIDLDAPPQTMTYQLLAAPAGASVNSSGVISWTPSEAQGGTTNLIVMRVVDNGTPVLSATNSFIAAVTDFNVAPVLPAQANRTIAELTGLSITNRATDSDIPTNNLAYALLNAPAGAAISSNGVITWIPAESQGPGVYSIVTVVTDDGTPNLSATNSFTVTVNEVNQAPVLPPLPNQTLISLVPMVVTNAATDADLPAQNLTYTLLTAPAGASISSNGVITWNQTGGQNRSTNLFTTRVTDDGTPALSATNTFTAILDIDPIISLAGANLVSEGCSPTNGAVDPGEGVSMLVTLKNDGFVSSTNLTLTLLTSNGVAFTGGAQNYGSIPALGGTIAQTFFLNATGACGSMVSLTFQVNDGGHDLGLLATSLMLGPTLQTYTQSFEGLTVPSLPAGWTTSSSNAPAGWFTTNSFADAGTNALFTSDFPVPSLTEITSAPLSLPFGPVQLFFRNRYSLESGGGTNAFDGGVIEIKIGTGTNFQDILAAGGSFVSGGYNGFVDGRYHNPLAGRAAWHGTNGGYTSTLINLPASAAGQTVQFKWRCGTDDSNAGGGWRIDSIAITGSVCCANSAPILGAQTNRTVNELAALVVTNSANDDPANVLHYSLMNAPAGATISSAGVVNWTPAEAQGPSSNLLITVVTDNAYPPLSATNVFSVIVSEVNSAPVLPVVADKTVGELSTLVITNTATDTDVPSNLLSYQLLASPAGATIDASGVISWTPAESQGPSTNIFTTVVTDNGVPSMSDTNTFLVVVSELNTAPVLPPQTDLTIAESTLLSITNLATDPDLPVNTLTYQLLNPPGGASINSAGLITWTPTEAQGPSTNIITTVVTDNGQPPLSATNTFTVVVTEVNSAPVLAAQTNMTIQEMTTLSVTNTAIDADLPANQLNYNLSTAPVGATIDSQGIISWSPDELSGPSTNLFVTVVTDTGSPILSATNSFTVVVTEVNSTPQLPSISDRTVEGGSLVVITNQAVDTDYPSNTLAYALISAPSGAQIDTNGVITWNAPSATGLFPNVFMTVVTDNGLPPLAATNWFTVSVLTGSGAPKLLDVHLVENSAVLTWSSISGRVYEVQYLQSLPGTDWVSLSPLITAEGSTATFTNVIEAPERYYRVQLLP